MPHVYRTDGIIPQDRVGSAPPVMRGVPSGWREVPENFQGLAQGDRVVLANPRVPNHASRMTERMLSRPDPCPEQRYTHLASPRQDRFSRILGAPMRPTSQPGNVTQPLGGRLVAVKMENPNAS